jgi:hypothetical protein
MKRLPSRGAHRTGDVVDEVSVIATYVSDLAEKNGHECVGLLSATP